MGLAEYHIIRYRQPQQQTYNVSLADQQTITVQLSLNNSYFLKPAISVMSWSRCSTFNNTPCSPQLPHHQRTISNHRNISNGTLNILSTYFN